MVKYFKDGKLKEALEFTFEQESDRKKVANSIDSATTSSYTIMSLDTIQLFEIKCADFFEKEHNVQIL